MAKDADEPTIWGAVAQPRRPVNTGTYMGDELAHRSSRPGAYDAMKLPSLISGQQRYLPQVAPSPSQRQTPARKALQSPKEANMSYSPREGSVPARVIAALQRLRSDDFLTSEQIARECNVTTSSVPAHLHTPIARGALIRVNVRGKAGFALPGFRAPEALPSAPPAPAPQQSGPQESPARLLPSPPSVTSAEDQLLQMATTPMKAAKQTPSDFAAALWSDGELELHGVTVPDDGCGYLRLTADQVQQIAALLSGRVFA